MNTGLKLVPWNNLIGMIIEADLLDEYEAAFGPRRRNNQDKGVVPVGGSTVDPKYKVDVYRWAASRGVVIFKGRPFTPEEAIDLLMREICERAEHAVNKNPLDPAGAVEQVVFSILAILDGSSVNFPRCSVVTQPSPEDRDEADRGSNYHESVNLSEEEDLHDQYINYLERTREASTSN